MFLFFQHADYQGYAQTDGKTTDQTIGLKINHAD